MKYLTEYRRSLEKVPPTTWAWKGKKTLLGALVIVGVVFMKRAGWFPDWFHMGLLVYGGYCLAGDVMRAFSGFVQAAGKEIAGGIREVRGALKGDGK